MVEAGLSWVRIGEFAWSKMEPSPGELKFEWLDEIIDILGTAGLSVVLGTPTATPPRWMLEKHPDMLAVDKEGRPTLFIDCQHVWMLFQHPSWRCCSRCPKHDTQTCSPQYIYNLIKPLEFELTRRWLHL